ncbi:hypothetical protein D9M72_622540 [compost metagenome]
MYQTAAWQVPAIVGGPVLAHAKAVEQDRLVLMIQAGGQRVHEDRLSEPAFGMHDQRPGEPREAMDGVVQLHAINHRSDRRKARRRREQVLIVGQAQCSQHVGAHDDVAVLLDQTGLVACHLPDIR